MPIPNSNVLSPARARMLRVLALVCATLLLAVAVAVACGGDEGNDDPDATADTDTSDASPTTDDDGIDVIMSTFTPTPKDFTPVSVQTRIAQQTAAAQTQTAQPDTSPTAPADVTMNPNTPVATLAPNTVKPPDVVMGTSGGQQTGSIGSMNWYDPTLNAGYNGDTPYVDLPEANIEWASGTQAQFTVPASPFAVRSSEVNIFAYDDNIAIPQNAQGQVVGSYVFARQTDPVQQATMQGPTLTLTPDVEPGNYIVEAVVTWNAPAELEANYNEALFTQYVFLVTVL